MEQPSNSISLLAQIQKRQAERESLEVELAREKIQNNKLSVEEITFFMSKFKEGDVNNVDYRTFLVDTFVSKVELFDDENGTYLDIYCNASPDSKKITLSEQQGSPKVQLSNPITNAVISLDKIKPSLSRKTPQLFKYPNCITDITLLSRGISVFTYFFKPQI